MLAYGRRQRGPIGSVKTVTAAREPVHAKRHSDLGAWAIGELVLLGKELDVLDLVGGEETVTERARVSPTDLLREKEPQVTSSAAPFQVDRDLLAGERVGSERQH